MEQGKHLANRSTHTNFIFLSLSFSHQHGNKTIIGCQWLNHVVVDDYWWHFPNCTTKIPRMPKPDWGHSNRQHKRNMKAWGGWPAKDPYGKAPLEDLSRDLPFQTLGTSSKMLDSLLFSLWLDEDGTREEGKNNNPYKRKSWVASPKYNSQKYPNCFCIP